MHIHELQKWVKDDWEHRSHTPPPLDLQLLYILEELGEVAEAIRKTRGSKERVNKSVDIGSEIADVVISVTTLANTFDVDLEKEIETFTHRLQERHNRGF